MQKYQDSVIGSGGSPIAAATITVVNYPAGTAATLYSDNGVTPISGNSVQSDSSGRFSFYAADGRYSYTISKTGYTSYTISDVLMEDYATTAPIASKLAASSGSSLVGFLQAGTGAVATDLQTRGRNVLYVTDFAANGVSGARVDSTGVLDSTAGIQAAINYAMANSLQLVFPQGSYLVDYLTVINSAYSFSIRCDNVQFIGNAAVTRNGVFDIQNAVDFHWYGNCRININNNTNYTAAFSIRAITGGSQATTRVNIHNIIVRNAKIAFSVGTYNVDYQCSEISFFGCSAFKCPVVLYNGGSQTGCSMVGCNLTSEANAAFAGSPQRAIWMEGGFVSVVGGEITETDAVTDSILLNPASSVTYSNPHGILRLVGPHLELASPIVISNPRALAAPTSDNAANLSITACSGYISLTASVDFIQINDATYSGYVEVAENNFYAPSARSGNNISSTSGTAIIKASKSSFNKNFKNWLAGISGGKAIHDYQPAMMATGIGVSIGGAGEAVVKFTTVTTTNELGRYGGNYSSSTGLFTVPAGGFASLQIACSVSGGGATTGDIYVKKNGVIVIFGPYTGTKGNVYGTLYGLVSGDTVGIYINGAASVAFDSGVYQLLQMFGANY